MSSARLAASFWFCLTTIPTRLIGLFIAFQCRLNYGENQGGTGLFFSHYFIFYFLHRFILRSPRLQLPLKPPTGARIKRFHSPAAQIPMVGIKKPSMKKFVRANSMPSSTQLKSPGSSCLRAHRSKFWTWNRAIHCLVC